MSGHDLHKGSPRQVLQDSCKECEIRARDVHVAIGHLDAQSFAAAWERAADWQQGRLPAADVSQAERPLLRALWAVQIRLDRRGFPLGSLPTAF